MEKHKVTLIILSFAISIEIIAYLSFSFIELSLDFREWDRQFRIWTVVSFLFGYFLMGYTLIVEEKVWKRLDEIEKKLNPDSESP